VRILQPVANPPDPDVLSALSKAYRAMGQETQAQETEKRLRGLLETRLY
jgi:hypothetical protein